MSADMLSGWTKYSRILPKYNVHQDMEKSKNHRWLFFSLTLSITLDLLFLRSVSLALFLVSNDCRRISRSLLLTETLDKVIFFCGLVFLYRYPYQVNWYITITLRIDIEIDLCTWEATFTINRHLIWYCNSNGEWEAAITVYVWFRYTS